jgi:hypothetical protein
MHYASTHRKTTRHLYIVTQRLASFDQSPPARLWTFSGMLPTKSLTYRVGTRTSPCGPVTLSVSQQQTYSTRFTSLTLTSRTACAGTAIHSSCTHATHSTLLDSTLRLSPWGLIHPLEICLVPSSPMNMHSVQTLIKPKWYPAHTFINMTSYNQNLLFKHMAVSYIIIKT